MSDNLFPDQPAPCQAHEAPPAPDFPSTALDIDLSSLEHAHMSLYEAFRIVQSPLTKALRLLFGHLFRHRSPFEEIKKRLDKDSRQGFLDEAGPWDVFVIFQVLLAIQGMFLDACSITNYNDREDLKKDLKVVYVTRNWFAGHGSCQHSDINGALIALAKVLLKMRDCVRDIPSCPQSLQDELQITEGAVQRLYERSNLTEGAVQRLYERSNLREASVSNVALHSISFALVSRALERIYEFTRSNCDLEVASDAQGDSFRRRYVDTLIKWAKKECAAVSKDFNAEIFSKHLKLLSKVRNSVFHGSREIIASMLDAAVSTIETLRMLNRDSESQALQKDVQAFQQLFLKSPFAQPLATAVANSVYQVAQNCSFFECIPAYTFDGSSTVCVPVISHVLKGHVQAPDVPPCSCLGNLPHESQKKINDFLKSVMPSIKSVAKFYSLEVDELRLRIETNLEQLMMACGRNILNELKCHPDYRCGTVNVLDDCEKSHIIVVLHFVMCKIQEQRGYDVVCPCVSSIGAIIDDGDSASTASQEVKKRFKRWISPPEQWNSGSEFKRIQLFSAHSDINDVSALLQLLQCDIVRKYVPPDVCPSFYPVVVKHNDQAFSQAYVDKSSGKFLVDREKQMEDAEKVLGPAAAGESGIRAAFLFGGPGMGKSQCGEEVLHRLGKIRAHNRCMEKVSCRSALAVKSGLVLLGRRMGKIIGVDFNTPVNDVLEAVHKLLCSCPYVIMLDDASIDGLEEAFRLLPISNAGCGLLVTSYLMKSSDFESRLSAKAAGAPVYVVSCECTVLNESKAIELFHLRGFRVEHDDLLRDVTNELKAMSYHPAGVRQFAEWCQRSLAKKGVAAKRTASALLDEETVILLKTILSNWKSVGCSIMMRNTGDSVCPTYDGMRAAAKINLHEMFQDGPPEIVETAKKLLIMMTLCPPTNTPIQLFLCPPANTPYQLFFDDNWVEVNVSFSLQRYWIRPDDDTNVLCDGATGTRLFSVSDDATREAIDLLQRHALIEIDGDQLALHQLMSLAVRAELGLNETLHHPGEEDLRVLQDVRTLLTALFGTVENDKVEHATAYPMMQTLGNAAEYMLDRVLKMMHPSNVCDSLLPQLRWMCGMFLRLANIQELVACDTSRRENLLLSATRCLNQLQQFQVDVREFDDLQWRLDLYEHENNVSKLLELFERRRESSNSKLLAATLMAIGDAYTRSKGDAYTRSKGDAHTRSNPLNAEIPVNFYQQARLLFEELSGPNSVDVATALNNIGHAHWNSSNYTEAGRYFVDALEIYIQRLGPEHPWVAVTYTNCGALFLESQQEEDFHKAMLFFRESLRIFDKALSSLHPLYAQTLCSIGRAYMDRGYYQDALQHYNCALEIFDKSLGREHLFSKDCQKTVNALAFELQQHSVEDVVQTSP